MLTIRPSHINGEIFVQSSKSVLHRAFICAALAQGESLIENVNYSDDVIATLYGLHDLGLCEFTKCSDSVNIRGSLNNKPKNFINCGESGSTLRMLLPLATNGDKITFLTEGRLSERPMEPYEILFRNKGVLFQKEGNSFIINGKLNSGYYSIDGNISSQFISGLLFKLPLLKGKSTIHINPPIESKPYINLTQKYQSFFEINSKWNDNKIEIDGDQTYISTSIFAEGDYSHAAFFSVGAALSGDVLLEGLDKNSIQGDKEIFTILKNMGAKVESEKVGIRVKKEVLKPINIDASDIPDLVPILAVAACAAQGVTKIYNAGRLRLKESDRLSAITSELKKIGANIYVNADSIIINGNGKLKGGKINAHNDHRIVMALTIASCISENDIIIDYPDAVKKSAPDFFKQFQILGGTINE